MRQTANDAKSFYSYDSFHRKVISKPNETPAPREFPGFRGALGRMFRAGSVVVRELRVAQLVVCATQRARRSRRARRGLAVRSHEEIKLAAIIANER
jgi:hypothetical protein